MNKKFIILLRKYAILFQKLVLEQLHSMVGNMLVLPNFYSDGFFQKSFEQFTDKSIKKERLALGKAIYFLNDYLKDESKPLKKFMKIKYLATKDSQN